MPSPVVHTAEHSLKEGAELPFEETIEESKERNQEPQLLQSQNQEPQLLPSQSQEAKEEHQGQQPPLLEEDKPPAANANPAKRNLSGSDDSDAGNGKPDM
jgi:hypothetical protein